MDHVNTNRISLAVLGSILFAMLLVAFSNLVFTQQNLAVPGFKLPESAAPEATAAAPKAAPETPLPVLLAKADPKKGQQDVHICQTCHNLEKGAGPKIGPPLWGVVGRPIASVAGFDYSNSLKSVGGNWTYEEINKMITNPRSVAPGTKMTFPGEPEAHKRADILAYLRTLSDNPVPFPTK